MRRLYIFDEQRLNRAEDGRGSRASTGNRDKRTVRNNWRGSKPNSRYFKEELLYTLEMINNLRLLFFSFLAVDGISSSFARKKI